MPALAGLTKLGQFLMANKEIKFSFNRKVFSGGTIASGLTLLSIRLLLTALMIATLSKLSLVFGSTFLVLTCLIANAFVALLLGALFATSGWSVKLPEKGKPFNADGPYNTIDAKFRLNPLNFAGKTCNCFVALLALQCLCFVVLFAAQPSFIAAAAFIFLAFYSLLADVFISLSVAFRVAVISCSVKPAEERKLETEDGAGQKVDEAEKSAMHTKGT